MVELSEFYFSGKRIFTRSSPSGYQRRTTKQQRPTIGTGIILNNSADAIKQQVKQTLF